MGEPLLRVAVVDDHPVFRMGMVGLLKTLPGIEVVAQADSGAQALAHIGADVDVVLMDLHLGDASGIEVTRELVARLPDLRVLVITMQEDDDSVVAAVRAGARGYLLKAARPEEVERGIRAVANGELILGPGIAAAAMTAMVGGSGLSRSPFPSLTQRELEVLELIARGLDNTSISRRLVLSPKTVRNHVSNLLAKLAVADRSAAIVKAREAGLGGE